MGILGDVRKLAPQLLKADAPPAVTETAKKVDPSIELAIRVFDWFSDPENFELDQGQPVFSFELCRRALSVDKAAIDEALRLLESTGVIARPCLEPNIRARLMRPIKQEWLKPGERARLVRIFKPEPLQPYVPFGKARVLKTKVAYVGNRLLTFNEGDILTDESHIRALLTAGGAVARLSETSATMCGAYKCDYRFDIGQSKPVDYPVLLVLQRIYFTRQHFTVDLKPGDLVADRSLALYMSSEEMRGRFPTSIRELSPSEYTCCPRCNHIQRRAELQKIS